MDLSSLITPHAVCKIRGFDVKTTLQFDDQNELEIKIPQQFLTVATESGIENIGG